MDFSVDKCPQCEEEFKSLGIHWSKGSCKYPTYSEKQKDIATGLLLGDGTLVSNRKNPRLEVTSITKEFLEWVKEMMGCLACDIKKHRDAKESAKHAREFGLNENAKEENYSDAYVLNLRSHPHLKTYKKWCEQGDKRVPWGEVNLNKTTTKVWYVCDGGLDWGSKPSACIYATNESDKLETIASKLDFDVRAHDKKLLVTRSDTKKFIDWLGEPIPGFKYKFSLEDKLKYGSMTVAEHEPRTDISKLKNDIRRVNEKFEVMSINDYRKHGRYAVPVIYNHFKSWNAMKEKLDIKKSKVKNQYN